MPEGTHKSHHHHRHHRSDSAAPSALGNLSGMAGGAGASALLPPKPEGPAPRPDALPPKPTRPAPRPVDLSALSGMAGAAGTAIQATGSVEKSSLADAKKSELHQLVRKTDTLSAPNPQYVEPEPESTGEKVAGFLKENAKNFLEDQFKEIFGTLGKTVLKQVKKAIKHTKKIGSLIQKSVKQVRQGAGRGDKFDLAMEWLGEIVKLANDANSFIGGLAKDIPLVGTIFTALGAAISFVQNLKSAIVSSKAVRHTRKRKAVAKERLAAMQADAPEDIRDEYVTKRRAKASPSKKEDLHFDQHNFGGQIQDAKTGKLRNRRLDEMTAARREKERRPVDDLQGLESITDMTTGETEYFGQQEDSEDEITIVDMSRTTTPEEDEETRQKMLEALEDYDIEKELTGANKKREADAIIKIVSEDVTTFSGAFLKLDPTTGTAVAKGMEQAVKGVKQGRKMGAKIRQFGRNRGLAGFDANKSDYNKSVRRHTLAVGVYERVKRLNSLNLEAVDPITSTPEDYQKIMPPYEWVGGTLDAMGVEYDSMLEAQDSDAIVSVMRGGFYRNGGKEEEEDDDDDDDDD